MKDHERDKSGKCKNKVHFSVTQSLLLVLQKSTNLQTHEIMAVLVDMYEQMVKDHELQLNKKSTDAYWGRQYFGWGKNEERWISKEKRVKKTIVFPNTNIYLSCNINIQYHPNGDTFFEGYNKVITKFGVNTNAVKVNFVMPQKRLHFSAEDVGEIMLEGELLDSSQDIEELKLKDTPTPAEKRAKAEAKKKEKEERNKLKKLNKTKTDSKKQSKKRR